MFVFRWFKILQLLSVKCRHPCISSSSRFYSNKTVNITFIFVDTLLIVQYHPVTLRYSRCEQLQQQQQKQISINYGFVMVRFDTTLKTAKN